jgi:hypothetical protein
MPGIRIGQTGCGNQRLSMVASRFEKAQCGVYHPVFGPLRTDVVQEEQVDTSAEIQFDAS